MRRNAIVTVFVAVVAAFILSPICLQMMREPQAGLQSDASAETVALSTSAEQPVPEETSESGEAAEQDFPQRTDGEPDYEQGVVLVELEEGATANDLNAFLADLDYIATESVTDNDIVFGYAELALSEGVDVGEALARLEATDGEGVVSAAQPNYRYHLMDSANASDAGMSASERSGNLANALLSQAVSAINDQLVGKQWALDAINAEDAWSQVKCEDASSPVTVAVLDTGIKTDHEDFDSARIVNPCNTLTGRILTGADDGNGHGTHVAGIIAATANNAKGVAGVSYNAQLMPIQVLDASGSGDTINITRGLDCICSKASDYNIRVVNLSLGADATQYDKALMDALATVHKSSKEILVVFSAGNDARSNGGAYSNFPSDYDNDAGALGVISIAKSGSTYKRSDFSNYNMNGQATKDISAPGSNILSTTFSGMQASVTFYSSSAGKYGYMDGTSMAAPHVSGIAALAFAANPKLTASQVRNILCNTAQDINTSGWDAETGYGLVDANAAVKAAIAGKSTTMSLAKATIALSKSSYPYNGSARKPNVTVTLNGVKLVKGTDYKVTYSNNIDASTSTKKATATITGLGAYAGSSASKTFTIAAKAITPTVTLGTTKYIYNGGVKKPTVTVKDGSTKLAMSDYTATYASGRKAVGKYSVKVTLKGNYSGAKTVYFTIVPAKPTIQAPVSLSKGFAAKWKKQATQTTGYQVQYSLKRNFASGNKTLPFVTKNTILSKKVTGLKGKTTYYVRVRAYKTVNGVKYYSGWSAVKSIKTKA